MSKSWYDREREGDVLKEKETADKQFAAILAEKAREEMWHNAATSQLMQQYAYQPAQQPTKQAVPEFLGQILYNGKPLPPEWRGAEYTAYTRSLNNYGDHNYWRLNFTSPWTSGALQAYFDAETHTGAQVEGIAKTFLEVINQRRLG